MIAVAAPTRSRPVPRAAPAPPPTPATSTNAPDTAGLDMTQASDRFWFAEAIRRSWPIPPEKKDRYFAALDAVLSAEMAKANPDARTVVQCAKILLFEQAHALKWLHRMEDEERKALAKTAKAASFKNPNTLDYDAIRAHLFGTRPAA